MGYSDNPVTLRKIERELEPLHEAYQGRRDFIWKQIPFGLTAKQWAYKVREGFYVARKHPATFPQTAAVCATYIIQQVGTMVVARFIEPGGEAKSLAAAPTAVSTRPSPVLVQASSVPEVIQFWLDCQPTSEPIRVLDAPLSNGELSELARWAEGLMPKHMLLQPKGTTSLTIALNDIRVPQEARIQS